MKTLYIDCNMGAAGDMLTAALLELLPDRDAALAELNALGIPGVVFEAEKTEKCGISGTHMHVYVHGEEEHAAEDVHSHEHHHHHGNVKHMEDIEHIVMDHLNADMSLKMEVLGVYALIAEA